MNATPPIVSASEAGLSLVREDAVAWLWLDRPAHGNRFGPALATALQASIERLACDDELACIVLAGRGATFCAGHDDTALAGLDDPRQRRAALLAMSDCLLALAETPKITVARVHGAIGGAGLELVAACDLAVCADDTRAVASPLRAGGWPHTTALALGRALPDKLAFDLLCCGREYDARALLATGLVSRVAAAGRLDEAISTMLEAIRRRNPYTLALGKYAYRQQSTMNVTHAHEFVAEQVAYHDAPAPGRGDES
ncbi:MAG: enoyl-CoA hydratase/isomerase family protein [Gammaproteobacteria bacterium]|nr:enoyl-CoA hydratase/isomerase family protein [Gammaproteobacteria bacterium]MCP5202103.1 enoyl-CoA hydratase/isomerase family protein [Gammaproteobacteria bacterium]